MQILSSEWIESLRFVVIAKRTKSYHANSALYTGRERQAYRLNGPYACLSLWYFRMCAILSLSVSMGEILTSLLALQNLTMPKFLLIQSNALLTSYVLFTDVRLAVHESPSCRPQISILPSFTAQWLIVHRPVTERSPPGDWSFTAQWTMGKSSNRNGMD